MKEKLRIAAINILLLLAVALAVGVPVLHQSYSKGAGYLFGFVALQT